VPKKVAHKCFQCSKLSNDESQTKLCWDAVRVGESLPQPPTLPAKQRAHQPAAAIAENTSTAIGLHRAINDYCDSFACTKGDRLQHNHSDRSPDRHRCQHYLLPRAPGCPCSRDSAVRTDHAIFWVDLFINRLMDNYFLLQEEPVIDDELWVHHLIIINTTNPTIIR
jgi:hypothetical protein